MDSFEHRLQQILDMEEISQAQFADRLGIQRGGLCHLLSGRNKPSFDFIVKLINSYPSVNSEWLLTGKGKPYKNDIIRAEIVPAAEPDDLPPVDELFPSTAYFVEQPTETKDYTPEFERSELPEKAINGKRTIDKVVIFFSDGTFEER